MLAPFDERWGPLQAWLVGCHDELLDAAAATSDGEAPSDLHEQSGDLQAPGEEELPHSAGSTSLRVQPAPLPPSGSILNDSDLIMCEDTWDDSRGAEVKEVLDKQGHPLAPRVVQRYEVQACRHWDMFYKRNGDRFFKDRHYTHKDFPELQASEDGTLHTPLPPPAPPHTRTSSSPAQNRVGHTEGSGSACVACDEGPRPAPHHRVLIEAGCGVGNAIFPLLELHGNLFVYGLDFSKRAIDLVRAHPLYEGTGRCRGAVCDIVNDPFPPVIAAHGGADLCMLMYSLSAIAPEHMPAVARKIYSVMKPGGRVLFRDYGRYDQAQLRFKRGHKLADHFYLRSDGTRAYYFTTQDLRHIFVEQAGFEEVECGYLMRQYVNREQQAARRRIWVHARFQKPST